jgi:ADP-ribose pyrophosphatase YjhB (NUDIX family)
MMKPDEGRVWMKPFPKDYPYPCVSAVILKIVGDVHDVILIKKNIPPFKGKYAFPGGQVEYHGEHPRDPVVSMQKLILDQTGLEVYV